MNDINDDFAEKVKNKSDIVKLIQILYPDLDLSLDSKGYLTFPSPIKSGDGAMYINPLQQSFYCENRKQGGDIFKFVMLHSNCDFNTAVHAVDNLFKDL